MDDHYNIFENASEEEIDKFLYGDNTVDGEPWHVRRPNEFNEQLLKNKASQEATKALEGCVNKMILDETIKLIDKSIGFYKSKEMDVPGSDMYPYICFTGTPVKDDMTEKEIETVIKEYKETHNE